MNAPAPVQTAPTRKINLPATYLELFETRCRRYFTFVPLGHTAEDLLQPEYWVHWAKRLRQNFFIDVVAEDGTFDGTLRVLQVNETWAKCVWFTYNRRDGDARVDVDYSPKRDLFKIEANARGWRLIEKASGKVIEKDLPAKSDAEKALDVYLATMMK